MNDSIKIFQRLKKFPLGKHYFTYLVCKKIPYFFSIKPLVTEYTEGRTVVQMRERKSLHNHLQTVHAIALCNLCELSMAMTTTATIPGHLRFIPVGMTVEYKKKAKGLLKAISEIKKEDFKVGEVTLHIDVFDEKSINVMSADIRLNIKEK